MGRRVTQEDSKFIVAGPNASDVIARDRRPSVAAEGRHSVRLSEPIPLWILIPFAGVVGVFIVGMILIGWFFLLFALIFISFFSGPAPMYRGRWRL